MNKAEDELRITEYDNTDVWIVKMNYHGPVIVDNNGEPGVFVGPEEITFFSKEEAFNYVSEKVRSVGFEYIVNVMIYSDDSADVFEHL